VTDFNNRGRAYLEKGEFSLAIRDLTRAIELIPQSANPYRHRGVAYFKSGKIDLARSDLTRALELKPDYEDAKTALAELDQAEISTKATPSAHTETEQAGPRPRSQVRARGSFAAALGLPERQACGAGDR
jgi:Tfp pilus assembly protein PilF